MGHEWQELAEPWERGRALLERATRPVSEWLVERLAPRPGETILELAAGVGETGFLAAPLLDPGGLLITSDREPRMVEAARRVAAGLGLGNVEFRVLDTDELDLADASVDGVLSRFGYVLKGKALREVARVLRPGGRLAFSAWADRGESEWMAIPRNVLVAHGRVPARAPEPPWDAAAIRALLREAGFADGEVEELDTAYRFADEDELWLYASELLGPVSAAIRGLDEAERDAVRTDIIRAAPRSTTGGYQLRGRSLNVITELRRKGME